MKKLVKLCAFLILGFPATSSDNTQWMPTHSPLDNIDDPLDRCSIQGIEAAIKTEDTTYIFKDDNMWVLNQRGWSHKKIQDEFGVPGSMDAAFVLESEQSEKKFYFLKNDNVWLQIKGKTESGYPRLITEEFPGVPIGVTAAVACFKEDCDEDSVLFFKEKEVYSFDRTEQKAEIKTWENMERCEAAWHWAGSYVCSSGSTIFTVEPRKGQVTGSLKEDALTYLLGCPGKRKRVNFCDGHGFDAMSSFKNGKTIIFRDEVMRVGLGRSKSQKFLDVELGLHGPVDAAFLFHSPKDHERHLKTYVFQGDLVWRFTNTHVDQGYPREVSKEFPGVPTPLDAAVECPASECRSDSVLFLKGSTMYRLDLSSHQIKEQAIPAKISNCNAAYRWLGRYYCFKGAKFYRFNPLTWEVPPVYPRDAKNYFLHCPGTSHYGYVHKGIIPSSSNRCNNLPLDALANDPMGRRYAFRGPYYWRLDTSQYGFHHWNVTDTWHGFNGTVDAAFSWEENFYIISGNHLWIFKADVQFKLLPGSLSVLQEKFAGVPDGIDAAFVCSAEKDNVYLVRGMEIYAYNMKDNNLVCTGSLIVSVQNRTRKTRHSLVKMNVEAAICQDKRVHVLQGDPFLEFDLQGPCQFNYIARQPGSVSKHYFNCTKTTGNKS
uniref:hemopexin n=1 Tax=Myxine glutinosa TaxID=7769 RepID=UPI00358EE82E